MKELKRPLRIASLDRAEDLEHYFYVLLFATYDWLLVLTLLRFLLFVIVLFLILNEGAGSRAERQEYSKQQTHELLHRDCFSFLLLPMVCRCANLSQNWLLRKSQYADLIWRQF